MSGHLVSVIVPAYNRADCLPQTLGTVLAQTHSEWELLLVDDGSTDNTREVVEAQFKGDARLRYIYQANAGVSNARNTGLEHARGDFIAFLDSDDCWMPWKLQAQLACMDAAPEVGMVWTDMESIDHMGALLSSTHLRTMYSAYSYHKMNELFSSCAKASSLDGMPPLPESTLFWYGDIYRQMILGSLVHTSTVLLRRKRAMAVGGFDETLRFSGEDYDFHLRTCREGAVGLLDVSSIQYRKGRPDRLTRHTDATAINFLRTVEKAIAADNKGRLRNRDVHKVLTEANAWVAREKFKQGDAQGLRRHAWQSLRRNPRQPRLFGLAALGSIPFSLLQRSLRTYRFVKDWLRETP